LPHFIFNLGAPFEEIYSIELFFYRNGLAVIVHEEQEEEKDVVVVAE